MSIGIDGLGSIAQTRITQFDAAWQDGPRKITMDAGAGDSSFGNLLAGVVSRASDAQDAAQSSAAAFARGEPIEMHQVMASAEEAGIAVEMLVEIRNKVLDAYHTLVSMQA